MFYWFVYIEVLIDIFILECFKYSVFWIVVFVNIDIVKFIMNGLYMDV